jgi:hypothetical protein
VSSTRLYTACLCVHFALLIAVSSRELVWFLAHGPTIFPVSFDQRWQRAEAIVGGAASSKSPLLVPIRKAAKTYLHLAGSEVGYSFFAPNVPDSYRLAFELHYKDGRVEYVLPTVHSHAAGLRLAGLLDKIGRNPVEDLRKTMIALFSYSVWREHADVVSIRAIFASTNLPTASEYERGVRRSDRIMAAYDFDFEDAPDEQQPR